MGIITFCLSFEGTLDFECCELHDQSTVAIAKQLGLQPDVLVQGNQDYQCQYFKKSFFNAIFL
jgi:hypothetical protein